MSATLVARDLSVSFGAHLVLDGVELVVAPGDRIGVVGGNGAGKSTLLRALAGLVPLDAGRVELTPPGATIGHLPQESERVPGETVAGHLARRTGVAGASAALDAAARDLAARAPGAEDAYAGALDRWLGLGGADLDARAAEVCADLGLVTDPGSTAHVASGGDDGGGDRGGDGRALLGRGMETLSGGQRARAGLAAVLLSRFDVVLLDEPTNDLDFDGLERLEAFVAGLRAPLVVVSHDRAFLDAVVTDVVELDGHTHRAARFGGGWSSFLEERATARRHAEEAHADYDATRRVLTERIATQRRWSETGARKTVKKPKDKDKARRGFSVNRTEKQASKVRQSEKALVRLEAVEKPWEGWDLRFTVATAPRSGAVTARLAGAVVELGAFTLGPVDLEIGWGERVAVLGRNGAGKSTLLGALLGRVPLAAGAQWLGPGVVVGEIDQARALLGEGDDLLGAFGAAAGMTRMSEARSLLAKFGLGAGHVGRTVASLSPGERTRAVMALLMARGVNCLVLDEPTNHLDLAAIGELEAALDTFAGTLLLITHDRALLDAVRLDRIVTVAGGAVQSRPADVGAAGAPIAPGR